MDAAEEDNAVDQDLDKKIKNFCQACDEDMNDDINTAKVLANLFEMAPIINGIKGGQISNGAVSRVTIELMKTTFTTYLEDILGLQPILQNVGNEKLDAVMELVIAMRKDARIKKDYAASDKIRDSLAAVGIQIKDEKDGKMSWTEI